MGGWSAVRFLVLVLAAASWASCSHRKTMGREDVQSEMRSLRSFAAETEMFLDFVLRGQATRVYAEEHAAYLTDEIKRSVKELEHAVAAPGVEGTLQKVRNGLGLLAGEISSIRQMIDNRQALTATRARSGNSGRASNSCGSFSGSRSES